MFWLSRYRCLHPGRVSLTFIFFVVLSNLIVTFIFSGLLPTKIAKSRVKEGDRFLKSDESTRRSAEDASHPFDDIRSEPSMTSSREVNDDNIPESITPVTIPDDELVDEDLIYESQPPTIVSTEVVHDDGDADVATPTDSGTDEDTAEPEPTKARLTSCPRVEIRKKVVATESDTKCKPHKPSLESCNHANDIYVHDTTTHSCKNESKIVICRYENSRFTCDLSVCEKDPAKLHLMDPHRGKVRSRKEGYTTSAELEAAVTKYSLVSVKHGYNFLFVSCAGDVSRTQLIPLVAPLVQPGGDSGSAHARSINMNFVLLDSVSRAHFYRSLKETVKAFESVNTEGATDAEVLDFEYFQAIHGHSAANARAFFKGDLFPKSYSDDEMEENPVGYEEFYEIFKAVNYSTLHQIDLCWTDVWGFAMDLDSPTRWKDLEKNIRKAHIDDTGLSFASCKMLKLHNLTNPYNTYDDQRLCYNGAAMDAYFLQYTLSRLSNAEVSRKPLVSVSLLNVGHDSGGLRIQTIDEDLAKFVKSSSMLDNTLTVIFADHGNTYTDYTYEDIEGQFEMYHPSLFMIFPPSVKTRLGKDVMNSIRENQKRLVTMLDLHQGVEAIANMSSREASQTIGKNRGFVGTISADKWCLDLPLFMPNMCLCEGWAKPMKNSTDIIGMMEFAVGELNRRIVNGKDSDGLVRGCRRLVPLSVENVMEKAGDGRVFVSLEIHTASVTEKHAVFKLELSLLKMPSSESFDMKVESFDRVSQYGKFKACKDSDVHAKLCVCDFENAQEKDITDEDPEDRFRYLVSHSTSNEVEAFKDMSSESEVTLVDNKLFVLVREYTESDGDVICKTFEVVNTSHDSFEVSLKFSEMSGAKPVTDIQPVTAKPATVVFLASFMRTTPFTSVDFEYEFIHKVV